MKRGAVGFGLLAVTLICLLVLEPLPVHAAATLVQQSNAIFMVTNATPSTFTMTASFSSSVTSGDVVVVGLQIDSLQNSVLSVTDSRSSSYSPVVSTTNVAIYDATLASTGLDTVHVQLSNACSGHCEGNDAIYIFEVSGVQTAGAGTGVGSTTVVTTGTVTTTPVNFAAGAFLLGVIYVQCTGGPCTDSAGAGFTLVTVPLTVSEAQYSTSGVTSPSSFPATHSDTGIPEPNDGLIEASIALNPIGTPVTTTTTTAPPIPEYPFGLPILAIVAALAYGLIRRKTRS